MRSGNETYSAIFNLFTYCKFSGEIQSGTTLKEILEIAKSKDSKDEIFCQVLDDAIRRYPELENARLLSPSWQQGGRYHSETHACVFELPNGDKYVAYRGTDDGGWIDNGQGMTQESTLMQREAAEYFDQMAEEHGWTEADNIYVTGHSKGGNKAQYVTLMSNHANLVDECYSLDGQGFSDEAVQSFKEKYGEEEYQKVLQKMYGYNGANDYVNPLGNTVIPKENITYINTVPNPDSEFKGWHMEEMMFQIDENGNSVAILGEKTERGSMSEFSEKVSGFLMSLPKEERDAAAMIVMQFMEIVSGDGYTGTDGTTLTAEEIMIFYKKVLPKLIEEVEKSMGYNPEDMKIKRVNQILIPFIRMMLAILSPLLIEGIMLYRELSQILENLGKRFDAARKKLESIIDWIEKKGNQLVEWFKNQRNSSDYSYFYIDSEQLLQIKEELAQKKTQLEEKADKIREIRKRVDFGNITQQYMYYCLVSSARNLENEAKAVNRLSKGLQNCVKVYKQNEQKVIGIYGKCGG